MSKKMEEQQKYIDIIAQIDNSFARIKRIRPLSSSEVNYFLQEFLKIRLPYLYIMIILL